MKEILKQCSIMQAALDKAFMEMTKRLFQKDII